MACFAKCRYRGDRGMIPKPARYLLRFDDLCPTMSRTRWRRFLPLIREFGIQPILAIIPDNQDPELQLDDPDPDFWQQMRAMEAAGATIGLHGYRHVCASEGKSLLPFHRFSEFAGKPEERQRAWIRAGLEILRAHGLNPCIWVAPRHGFDRATLRALCQEGIETLSDGLARVPFSRSSVAWIPQQLWGPADKAKGLWTILVHANTASDALVLELEMFVRKHAAQFTSVDRVIAEFPPAHFGFGDRLAEVAVLLRLKQRQIAKRFLGRA
jgi:predicted deacetylase